MSPNAAEWAMDVEDVLLEMKKLTQENQQLLKEISAHTESFNKSFPGKVNKIVGVLKRIAAELELSPENTLPIEEIEMENKNVFIVYSHQQKDIMHEIKDYIREEFCLIPKTLDAAKQSGNIWNAFVKEAAICSRAIVIMTEDDTIIPKEGEQYKQARPNVLIEMGYLFCQCKQDNVIIVRTKNCNIPSDIEGLIYVVYKSDNWKDELRKQLNKKIV